MNNADFDNIYHFDDLISRMMKKQKKRDRGVAMKLLLLVFIIMWIVIVSLGLHIASRHHDISIPYNTLQQSVSLSKAVFVDNNDCDTESHRLTMNHKHNLTNEDLRRSRAWVGNEQRLEIFTSKLASRKEPVSVVVYGGSISMGHGLEDGEYKYLNQFENWMNEMFPVIGYSGIKKHTVFSRAGHGADMCFVSKRLMKMIDDIPEGQKIDMFILEFAVNDYQGQDHKIHLDHKTDVFFDGFQRLALCTEAVVSKLLKEFPKAAIVFLEFQTAILNRKTAQLLHLGVAQHYQIPVISYAETLFPGFFQLMNMLEPHSYSTVPGDSVLPFPHGCEKCLDQYIAKGFRDKGCKSLCTYMTRSGRECTKDDNLPKGRAPCYLPFLAHDAVHPSMIGHQIAKDLLVNAIVGVRHSTCNGFTPVDHVLPPTTFLGSPKQLDRMTDFVMIKDTMGVYSKQDPLDSKNHSEGFTFYGDSFAERKGWIATDESGDQYLQLDIDLEQGCYEILISLLKSYEGMGIVTIDLTDRTNGKLVNSVTEDCSWSPRISIPADVLVTNSDKKAFCRGKCSVTIKTHPQAEGRNRNKVKVVSLAAQKCMS